MKKMIIALMMIVLIAKPVKADEITFHKTIATAYCLTGTTATGTYTTEGRTVAGKREWFGYTMYVWLDDGDGIVKPENFIGMYSVEDTGGETIQSGNVIDIYIADYARAKEFGAKNVLIQLVKAEG